MVLEGVQAEDDDAAIILELLEKTMEEDRGLGKFANYVLNICRNGDTYDNFCLQNAATTAFLR